MLHASLTEVFLGILLIFLQGFLPKSYPLPQLEDVLPQKIEREEAVVEKVIDGDTLSITIHGQKEKVRLLGIDTPETVDPRSGVECFGKEASNKMKQLVEKKRVLLEDDSTQLNRDRYQRLLRYVFLPDGTFVNKTMIEQGFAFEYTYQNAYRYQKDFRLSEEIAQKEKRGLWNDLTCPR